MSSDWRNDPIVDEGITNGNAILAAHAAVEAYKLTLKTRIDTAAIIDKAVAAHYSKHEISPGKIVWEYGSAQARRVARDVAEAVLLAVVENDQ